MSCFWSKLWEAAQYFYENPVGYPETQTGVQLTLPSVTEWKEHWLVDWNKNNIPPRYPHRAELPDYLNAENTVPGRSSSMSESLIYLAAIGNLLLIEKNINLSQDKCWHFEKVGISSWITINEQGQKHQGNEGMISVIPPSLVASGLPLYQQYFLQISLLVLIPNLWCCNNI